MIEKGQAIVSRGDANRNSVYKGACVKEYDIDCAYACQEDTTVGTAEPFAHFAIYF